MCVRQNKYKAYKALAIFNKNLTELLTVGQKNLQRSSVFPI